MSILRMIRMPRSVLRAALAGARLPAPILCALALWSTLPHTGIAQPAAGAMATVLPARTITNPDEVWQMSTEERGRVYPLEIEGRVNFYDAAWGSLWFEHEGQGRYVRLASNAPLMRNGQRVRIEGTFIPNQGLAADRVKVTVLSEYEPIGALETKGRITEVRSFDRKVVLTEGYVDEQQLIDSQHLRLMLIVEDRRVICWVPPDANAALPDWQGCFLRVKAVYSGRLDPTGTEASVELWTARQSDVEVLGSIASDPKFSAPLANTVSLSSLPVGSTVRLRGQIRRRELGASFVLRDNTGEVLVRSLQNERVPQGAEIEVVGRTAVSGSRWVLESALFRRAIGALNWQEEKPVLDRADRVRQLTPAEASEGRPVAISGVVTWSLPEAEFFFIQDLSGGMRVNLPAGTPPPPLQKSGTVIGTTARGTFGPVVSLRQFHDSGSMAHPFPKRITYAQAISGAEDGQWVEMRGFIRRTASEGDWRWIYVTTPDGEFVGHLQSPVNFVATPGSLLRVRGVCEVTTDAKNRASGVRLRVPFLHDILIEEDAPAEVFDLPLRRIADLRQVFSIEELARARVSAQVVHHVPGQYIVVQDGEHGMTIYSREPGQLTPGDTIEAVGIIGQDGARMVLREAVFRRTKVAPAPAPVALNDGSLQDPQNDFRLVRVQGRLLDFSQHADRVHFTLLGEGQVFDATLDHPVGAPRMATYNPGVTLELTGIYRLEFDDFDRPRGFQVQLRSESDVVVLIPARFWTVGRALAAAGGLCGCLLVFFGWLIALRHRVRVQTEQIREQLEKQSSLESELERAQRFRSLGLLAGGLAHDFNNLLTGILGNVTLAMLDERVMAFAGESLRDIEASAKRARDLTQQLVTFAKGGDPLREVIVLPDLLHNAAGFALSGAKARAAFDLAVGLWPAHADRNQLGRALQNLIVHARSSMPEGGIITINAANETIDAATGALQPGRYVRLTIADRGPGLAPERLPGFFDPYASTKFGDDRFSLAIAYSIVKRHGGNLEVESAPGAGTTFRMWIPAAAEQPVAAVAVPLQEEMPISIAGTRVLLMDDEQTIRRLGERLLTRLDCEIRTAPDGETCLQLYREALAAGRRFQIVILDLTVPGGMGGAECMAELLKIDPEVRAIVSSGYSNDPVMANFRQHGFRAVVPKPYAVNVLADAITRVLGAPR
ncbi:MAG TPA: ATP-binding protein [Opitutaceae bacterium]|nr:ATP-binding protein [Opitutaceae bacterium]